MTVGLVPAQAQTRDAPALNKKAAKDMCAAHGGVYMSDLQVCEVEGEK